MKTRITLEQIEGQAPADALAYYGATCCWWATDPGDLGHVDPSDDPISSLPCCPHCGGVLLQMPLADFLKSARSAPEGFYGPYGLDAFALAHAANSDGCAKSWRAYNMALSLEQEVGGMMVLGGDWRVEARLVGPDQVRLGPGTNGGVRSG